MKKKVLALVLMLVVLASVLTMPAAAAGGKTFPDAKGHWAEESIMRWSRCGLVNGDDLGNVNPDKPLRRCEMATILSNMLGLRTAAPVSTFRDIDGTEWYARAILRCAAAGIMQGSSDSMSLPEDYITREEAITMFCRALNVPRDDDPDLSKFSDGDKVSGWAAPYMTTLTELGILSGMGDGTVAPHSYINRAGAFTLMDKAISVYANAPGNYPSQNPNGFIVINANTYQPGDVIVSGKAVGVLVSVSTTDTVRLRDFSSENVDINGKGSVIIAGKSSLANVEAHTEIELTVEANATIDALDINSEKITLTNAGTVKNLNCDKVATVTNSGKVENLVADAAVSITNTGTVDKLVANAGIKVDNNKGTIKNAEINKGGVVMDGAPQQMTVATGVARPNNSGGRPVTASGAVSTPSSGSSDKRPSGGSSTTVAVESVNLLPSSYALKVGDEGVKLEATVEPKNATNTTLTWKSNRPDVAEVDKNGKVTAKGVGEVLITATSSNGMEGYCSITVLPENAETIPLKDLWTLPSGAELDEGDTLQLELYLLPNNATVVKDSIKWESHYPNIATVSDTGLVTAMSKGTTEIVVSITVPVVDPSEEGSGSVSGGTSSGGSVPSTSGGSASGGNIEVSTQEDEETETTTTRTATCKITVRPKTGETVAVESVSISGKPESVKVGDKFTLEAKVSPEEATDKTVTWSSNNMDAATVDMNSGEVTAVGEGEVTITATSKANTSIKDTFMFNVTKDQGGEKNPVVRLSQTSLTLTLKDGETVTETLKVTVDDEETTEGVTWSSGNNAVATVVDGLVTAVGKGTTSITAIVTIDGEERTLTCDVEVKEKIEENPSQPTITAVTLDKTGTIELTVDSEGNGGTVTITATIVMSEGSSATGTVAWSVTGDEDAVEHNETGNAITVTAKSAGTVTITATAGTKSAECTVKVEELPAPPADPTIDKVEFGDVAMSDITKGEAFDLAQYLDVAVTPAVTTYTTTWEVVQGEGEEEAVATVDNNGQVTFTAAGEVTVKVTVTITVEGGEPITEIQTITLELEESSDEDDQTPGTSTTPTTPEGPGTGSGEGEDNENQPSTGDGE